MWGIRSSCGCLGLVVGLWGYLSGCWVILWVLYGIMVAVMVKLCGSYGAVVGL